MTTMPGVAPSKLPLWRTVGGAYAVWATNFLALIRIVWPWMLVTGPVLVVYLWWDEPRVAETMRAASTGNPVAPEPLRDLISEIAGWLILLPALASVAVAWHRLLLRDEHPRRGVYLRLDNIVVGYAVLAFWIGLVTLAPGYASRMFQIATGTSATAGDVAASVIETLAGLISIISFFVVARLSLALPGLALGGDDVGLGRAWTVSKHNTWRLFWAYLLCSIPEAVIAVAILWLSRPHGRAAGTLISLVISLLWIPVGMIGVGVLSLAYRHFFERGA